jgi:hypothetical protein
MQLSVQYVLIKRENAIIIKIYLIRTFFYNMGRTKALSGKSQGMVKLSGLMPNQSRGWEGVLKKSIHAYYKVNR